MKRRIDPWAAPRSYALWLVCLGGWPAPEAFAFTMPDPPPICPTDGGMVGPDGSCTPGAHTDHYWPRDCPHQNHPEEDLAPLTPSGHVLYCRPPEAAPRPLIACTETLAGTYLCEGDPTAPDGSLSYAWSAPELDLALVDPADPTLVTVVCHPRNTVRYRYITLTVSSTNGTTATVTGPLACPVPP